jgi:hypothetical protein
MPSGMSINATTNRRAGKFETGDFIMVDESDIMY